MSNYYYSHGKLLITGEYAVLDGALCLAVPTRKGQSLWVDETNSKLIHWRSIEPSGKVWFETEIRPAELSEEPLQDSRDPVRSRLLKLLFEAKRLNPAFLPGPNGGSIATKLEFPRNWGLGSSSTLVNNVAHWAGIDPFLLQDRTFGGSGYDIACAGRAHPILYKRINGVADVQEVSFEPPFKDQLFFIYLNRKQDSRKGIEAYRKSADSYSLFAEKISGLTSECLNAQSLLAFEECLAAHEQLVSGMLKTPPVKERLFKDYPGAVKSLGAWGGDFILATGGLGTKEYFRKKGFNTVVGYSDMVL